MNREATDFHEHDFHGASAAQPSRVEDTDGPTLEHTEKSIVLAGIDEAGYGPTLGPLCVAMATFRLPRAGEHIGGTDLWSLLERGVCREPGRGGKPDARGRIAVADSKQLKLSNQAKSVHPLVHLERGVLGFLLAGTVPEAANMPADDRALLTRLGAKYPKQEWYGAPPVVLPVASDAGSLYIAASQLRGAMHGAGITLESLRCEVVGEAEFNMIARGQTGRAGAEGAPHPASPGKAATTQHAITTLLRSLWKLHAIPDAAGHTRCGLICDRLGGRMEYSAMLRGMLPGAEVRVVEETPTRSKYTLTGTSAIDRSPRALGVTFLVESERHHLPVALASMTAKYARELAMLRFNRWWCTFAQRELGVKLRPTAGYALDARRWLHDANGLLSPEVRRELVRVV